MVDKKFRNLIARVAAATMAAGSIFGGAALGLAAGAHASPMEQAQAQQRHAMHSPTDPAARRQEGPRVPARESTTPPHRPAAPGEPREHHMPQRTGGGM